jgi:predicted regulator of Ras-like GTPase activity (Roadblock/LC7/MglB family)
MATRQSELLRVLGQIANELPQPHWVALVDSNGLVMSCVPTAPAVAADTIAAMAAALAQLGQRSMNELEGGRLRVVNVAGAKRQQVIVMLKGDHLLSVGLGPDVPAQSAFAPLGRWVPELLEVLDRRFG